MTVYKINEKDRKVNIGKVVLRRLYISLFGCILYSIIFLIVQNDISKSFYYLAFICGVSFLISALLIPVDISKKKKENEVFRIKIDETHLTYNSPKLPQVQLALAKLQTIQLLPKKGIRLIFTTPDIKLFIPDTLEHFEELLQKLENIKPIEPFSLATNEKQLVILRLAAVTGFFGVLFFKNTTFLWLAGIFTICIYSYLLFQHHKTQQSLNTSNQISWPILLPLIFTVLILCSKLW